MTKLTDNRRKRGLTLIEILIALLILSVGVSSMMVAMSRCLSVVRTARNRNVAHALIRRIDIEHPIEPKDMEELSEAGTFDDTPGYTWQREIIVVDEEERPGLFLVILRVQWSERGRDAYEELITYQYAPNAASVTGKI